MASCYIETSPGHYIPSWWLRGYTRNMDIDIARNKNILEERKLWEERKIEEALALELEPMEF
jgi:hypothetical protein